MITRFDTKRESALSDFIIRGGVQIMEIVGISDRSFEDRILKGLHKASEQAEGITGIEILHQTARVDDNRITQFHVDMKIAFGARSHFEGLKQ